MVKTFHVTRMSKSNKQQEKKTNVTKTIVKAGKMVDISKANKFKGKSESAKQISLSLIDKIEHFVSRTKNDDDMESYTYLEIINISTFDKNPEWNEAAKSKYIQF